MSNPEFGPATGKYRIRKGDYCIARGDKKVMYPEVVALTLEEAWEHKAILMERFEIELAYKAEQEEKAQAEATHPTDRQPAGT